MGSDFSDYFTEPEKAKEGYQQVFKVGFVRDYPLEILHKDGHITPVLYNASIYKDESGEIIGVFAAARDITERKEAEIQLQRLANVIESSDDAIISKTLEGVITSWNRGAEVIYGYSSEEVVGKNISILVPNHLKEEIIEITKKIKAGNRVFHHDTTRIRKDGTEINLSLSESPLLDTSGNLIGISTIERDITDRKNAEEALRFIQLYTRSLLEVNIDPLFIIGPDGKITDLNKAVELATGYSRDQIIGTDFSDYFTDPNKAQAGYEEVYREGVLKDHPLEIQHKNGHIMPVLYNASIYKDEKGQVIGVFAAARDITQLKKAEEQLQEHMDNLEITVEKRTTELTNANALLKAEIKERKRMEQIILDNVKRMNLALESAQMGAWDLDIVNDTAIRTLEHDQIFGYDSLLPEWGVKIFFEHILPEDREYVQQRFENAYETNKLYFQCRIKRADKKIRWIESYGNVYCDDKDVPIRVLGVFSDITERKGGEEELLKAIGEKEMLLREIHHRVYNNMQIISSILSLESSHVFDERDVALFMTARDRVTSMGLIHGSLYQSEDLSSIKFEEYLNRLTSQLLTIYAEDSNIKFVTDIIDISLNMETAIPLGLIINELVINSLKHAFPELKGEISISVHSKGEEIELIIKDNGVGLPNNIDLKKPKELGLQLVNSLVEQLEGTIELVKSHGTGFKIKFKELEYKERL